MKLIKNEKLLNTFMMLIFPKTCLYETYSVMKCLDMVGCYFKVILDHGKKILQDFQYNYFYTGVRSIIESNHSVLIQIVIHCLLRFFPCSSSITTSSQNNSKKLSITILLVMSSTYSSCTGANPSEISFICLWHTEFQSLKNRTTQNYS